jgi:peptidoglycan DL-endopeptidase CwlO
MLSRQRRRLGVLVGIAILLPVALPTAVWGDPLDEKRAEAARLEEQLEKQGEQVSVTAERYNRARLEVSEIEGSVARTEGDLARSEERMQAVRVQLARTAVVAYTQGGNTSLLNQLARGVGDDMVVRRQYLRITAADQRKVIGELRLAREDLTGVRSRLQAERAAAREVAEGADAARRRAMDAEETQRTLLAGVRGDLTELVSAERARREAAEAADAAARRQAAAGSTDQPPTAAGPPVPAAEPAPKAQGRPQAPAVEVAPSGSSRGDIAVAEAKRQLGKPYVWGGSGPDSYDCSGLTAWAWKAAGVSLSHSAYTQWFETTRVPVDQVQPGDLLFFGDSVEGIHHNAIYAGNGEMVEASQTGTPVRIRGWRSVDLVGAGRPG